MPLVLVLGVVGWLGFSLQHAINSATDNQGGSVFDALNPKKLPGEDTGRVNLLLTGNSFDDQGHGGAGLTDSIMVASIDVATKKVTLISVPRDLLVTYQGQNMKINAVYVVAGEGLNGLNALGKVVEQVTGLHIDQHMLVGYNALRDAVNAVGGIDVNITAPKGIYDPNIDLTLPHGMVHLDGETALKLARARNDPVPGETAYGLPYGDFDRQKSQRMILTALVDKAKSSAALANPVKIVDIFNSLSKNLQTDLTVSQISRLYQLTKNSGEPTSITINGSNSAPLLTDYNTSSIGDALVPNAGTYNYTQIKSYVASMLAH